MLFPRILVQNAMQTTSSMIWTLITKSISNDDSCYATSSSFDIFVTVVIIIWALCLFDIYFMLYQKEIKNIFCSNFFQSS